MFLGLNKFYRFELPFFQKSVPIHTPQYVILILCRNPSFVHTKKESFSCHCLFTRMHLPYLVLILPHTSQRETMKFLFTIFFDTISLHILFLFPAHTSHTSHHYTYFLKFLSQSAFHCFKLSQNSPRLILCANTPSSFLPRSIDMFEFLTSNLVTSMHPIYSL